MRDMLSLLKIIAEDNIKLYIYGTKKEGKEHWTPHIVPTLNTSCQWKVNFRHSFSCMSLPIYYVGTQGKDKYIRKISCYNIFKETNSCEKQYF